MKKNTSYLIIPSILLLLVTVWVYATRIEVVRHIYGQTDFFEFYQSMRFYFAGQNLYTPFCLQVPHGHGCKITCMDANLNPPFFTLLLLPLYFSNYATALTVWSYLSLILFGIGIVVIVWELPVTRSWPILMAIASVFLVYAPNSASLAYGQLGALCFAGVTFLWIAMRHNYHKIAGILLGFIASIKLFFGLFFIYFLLLRYWRLLVTAIVTYGIGFSLGLYFFGMNSYLQYQATLHKIHWYATGWNASWLGQLMRWFSPLEGNHVLWHAPALVLPLMIVGNLFLLAYLCYITLQTAKERNAIKQKDLRDLSFGLTLIMILLLSPLGWLYYFGMLALPFLILHHQAQTWPHGWKIQLALPALLFLSCLTGDLVKMRFISTLPQILWFESTAFYSLAGFLWVMMIAFHQRQRLPISLPPPSPLFTTGAWCSIYFIAVSPSIFSLFFMLRNLLLIKLQVMP